MSKKQLDAYRDAHSACEACGNPAPTDYKYGDPHHIRTKGAGGGDNPENLLRLCGFCHQSIHIEGTVMFLFQHPHLEEKVLNALPHLKEEMQSDKPFWL